MPALRTALRLFALVVVAHGSGCTCAASHERAAPDAAPDAPAPRECAAPSVVSPAAPWPRPPAGTICSPEVDRACRTILQAFVPSGHARSACVSGACARGDRCGLDGGAPSCDCDGEACAPTEICASDTPAGPARCVPFCLPLARELGARCDPPSAAMASFDTVLPDRSCDDGADAACSLYATALLPYGHHALGQCRGAPGGESFCVTARFPAECATEPGGPPTCTCHGVPCAEGELCGEVPDGAPTCYPICSPLDPRL